MHFSIRQILLATDFSESARQAQCYAFGLAVSLRAQLHVLHVVTDPHPLPSVAGLTVGPVKDPMPQIIKNAEEQLAVQMEDDVRKYPQIRCVVKGGDAVRQIKDYADTHDIDLIVIGTHGRTGISHLIIGSVAEKVVRLATCPVLTVHPSGQ